MYGDQGEGEEKEEEERKSMYLRPVLVFLHGHSFAWNSGSNYDAGPLAAASDLLIVTINYRLGLLGSSLHTTMAPPF